MNVVPKFRQRLNYVTLRSLLSFLAYVLVLAAGLTPPGYALQLVSDSREQLRPPTSSKDRVSVYPIIAARKHHALVELTPADLFVSDNGHRIDNELLQLSTETPQGNRPVLFLFDQLDPVHASSARQLARKALKEIPDQVGAVAVWAIQEQLELLQDFTSSRSLVSAAIDATARGAEHTLDDPGAKQIQLARELVTTQRAPWWAATLEAAAETLVTMPGRKAIVYFTEDAPSGMYAAGALSKLSQQLQAASVSLFVIDMNAIDQASRDREGAAMAIGLASSAARQSGGAPDRMLGKAQQSRMGETMAGIELGDIDTAKPLLRQVASDTEGGYSNGGENLKRLMRAMVRDLSSYCAITYLIPAGPLPAFHPVVVRSRSSTWKGGYLAQHRELVAARAPSVEKNNKLAAPDTMDRLTRGSAEDSLVIRSAMLRLHAVPQGIREVAAVEVPIRELEFREDGNTKLFSFHASIAIEIFDASGTAVAREEEEFSRHGATEAEEQARSAYLSFARPVVLPAGGYSLRAVLRDWNSGKTGSITEAFTTTLQTDEEPLSDLLLVRSMQQQGAETGLVYGQETVVPNLSGTTDGSSGKVSLYFQQYGAGSAAGPRTMSLEVKKNGKLIHTMPLHADVPLAGQSSAEVATVTLGDGPGVYDLILCLEQQGHTLRRSLFVTTEAKPDAQAETEASRNEAADPEADRPVGPPRQSLAGQMLEDRGFAASSTVLSGDQQATLIEAVRSHALSYAEHLPNFFCLETLDRSEDRKGKGDWKHRDTILEQLFFRDGGEKRTVMKVNGERSHLAIDSLEGTRSSGEFGGILQAIFEPGAQAHFAWERAEEKDGVLLQIFHYSVPQEHSAFTVTSLGEDRLLAAFEGELYIDSETQAVRRLVAVTRGLPKHFSIQSTWIALDYDYVNINSHEYLLPTRGEVGSLRRKQRLTLNELHFDAYRRFGSQVRIVAARETMSKQP